ncbi:hypothetical protein C8J56DRAFT_780713 [Mycena floridula]|nr:hypothetical protein C8J56DRAFT_780713 [Mycena floridula]
MRSLTLPFFFLSLFPWSLLAANVTIDDTYGDPTNGKQITYAPVERWTVGQTCSFCAVKPPNSSQMYNGSWHDCTSDPSVLADAMTATVEFNGACFLLLSTNLTFFLDGAKAGSYIRKPVAGKGDFEYNIPFYANTSLPAGSHSLVIQNGSPGSNESLLLLDSIVYTLVLYVEPAFPLLTSFQRTRRPKVGFTWKEKYRSYRWRCCGHSCRHWSPGRAIPLLPHSSSKRIKSC